MVGFIPPWKNTLGRCLPKSKTGVSNFGWNLEAMARGHHPSIRLSQLVPWGLWDTLSVESDVTVVTISSSTDQSNSKTTSDRFHFLLRFTDGSTTLKVCALSLFNSFFMTSMPSLFGIPWFSRSFVVNCASTFRNSSSSRERNISTIICPGILGSFCLSLLASMPTESWTCLVSRWKMALYFEIIRNSVDSLLLSNQPDWHRSYLMWCFVVLLSIVAIILGEPGSWIAFGSSTAGRA